MHLYSNALSGNCQKVWILLSQLGIEYETTEMDVVERSDRDGLLAQHNLALRVPVLVLDDGRGLGESGAILTYLAEGTPFLPDDRFARAKVLQWMFFEQYEVEPSIAVARFMREISPAEPDMARVAELQTKGRHALGIIERHLAAGRDYLVDDRYSIADIMVHAYTHVAGGAGIDLADYPNVIAWHERVRAQPGYVPMG